MTIDNDFYTVLMVSTINSMYGKFSSQIRFDHTMIALDSIIKKIPKAKILFIDNSNEPIKDEWQKQIKEKVTVFHQLEHNLFSLVSNINVATKSESEANMLFKAFDLLRQHNLLGKRIFKISGRYRITDEFDMSLYEKSEIENKYTFVVTSMASSGDNWITQKKTMWLEQALISFTPANLDEFQRILIGALADMRKTGNCIEETLFHYIPHENIVPIDKAHIEGLKAEGNEIVRY